MGGLLGGGLGLVGGVVWRVESYHKVSPALTHARSVYPSTQRALYHLKPPPGALEWHGYRRLEAGDFKPGRAGPRGCPSEKAGIAGSARGHSCAPVHHHRSGGLICLRAPKLRMRSPGSVGAGAPGVAPRGPQQSTSL